MPINPFDGATEGHLQNFFGGNLLDRRGPNSHAPGPDEVGETLARLQQLETSERRATRRGRGQRRPRGQ